MTLKRYLSTLVSPISPRRPRTPSIASPVSVRSPIEDLRDFWKKTFDQSLECGEEYREAALASIHAQRGLLSDAEVWDLQTMNDGYVQLHKTPTLLVSPLSRRLVVERDDLSDFAQSPEKLNFDIVSRASRYKSRAQSLYSEVEVSNALAPRLRLTLTLSLHWQEVVRRSQPEASLEGAHRATGSEYARPARRGVVTRHADVSDRLPSTCQRPFHLGTGCSRSRCLKGGNAAMYRPSHGSQYTNGRYAGTEHCDSPPAYDSCSSSSSDSRSHLASLDRHEALIGSMSNAHGSTWETTADGENYGAPHSVMSLLSSIGLTTVRP